MKFLMLMLFVTALSTSTFAREMPQETLDGYTNPNNGKTYEYSPWKGEDIWYENGRPYWKAKADMAQTQIAPAKEIKDSDGDGVANNRDQCADTLQGALVDVFGCAAKKDITRGLTLDVKFKSGSSELDTTDTVAIDKLANVLKSNQDLKIEVQGHTDNTGKESFNKHLSKLRSQEILSYLEKNHEINTSRLTAKGYGSNYPLTDNSTQEGRRANRRAEIKIIR